MTSIPHSNRLAGETSRYLRQHAANPVDWYPWSAEALDKARREDKPIFLSIGYSACHWCHVMAHESFENEETARLMNEWFVNIKVDREERPDLDALYMKALVAMTGHGGWPMSLFLTPDQHPYFGGTYFPPEPRHNRPGFPQILRQAHDLYRSQKDQLQARAHRLLEKIRAPGPGSGAQGLGAETLIEATVNLLAEKFDEAWGGFGSGMKFPETMLYHLLLRHWVRTGADASIQMVDRSLTRMAEGGLYDQIGGGFHRYSTDREWRVPHFEKMLYDNALLARLYLETFQATKQELYRRIPEEIFGYIEREMTSPEGAFYASQDADTDAGEGHFFTWELKEVLDLLGPRHAQVFARAYGLTPRGNFEGRNVLHVAADAETISKEQGIAIFEVDHILKTGRQALLRARQKRTPPGRDEKVLAGWNGMMISAYALGYCVLCEESYRRSAVRAAEFIWETLWDGRRLRRVYAGGVARFEACLEDYAWFLEAVLSVYEATLDPGWIDRARQLADVLINDFWDESGGGFFMTGRDHEPLIARLKSAVDEALPSPNAVAALALLKLGRLTGEARYLDKGRGVISAFRPQLEARPTAHTALLAACDFDSASPTEAVLAGPAGDAEFEKCRRVLYEDFRPNKLVAGYAGPDWEERLPLTRGRGALQGRTTVYLCQKQTCLPPIQEAEELRHLLEKPPIIRLNIFDEAGALRDMEKKEQDQFLNAMSQIFKFSGLNRK